MGIFETEDYNTYEELLLGFIIHLNDCDVLSLERIDVDFQIIET